MKNRGKKGKREKLTSWFKRIFFLKVLLSSSFSFLGRKLCTKVVPWEENLDHSRTPTCHLFFTVLELRLVFTLLSSLNETSNVLWHMKLYEIWISVDEETCIETQQHSPVYTSVAAFALRWQSWAVVTETTQTAKLGTFIVKPFMENVCWSLISECGEEKQWEWAWWCLMS